ncbi:MAG: hypothetical protein ABIP55_16070 [Tepidisphaeraceae bacterium]
MKTSTFAAALILLILSSAVTSVAPGAAAPDTPHHPPTGEHASATAQPQHDHGPVYHHPTLPPPHTIWPGMMVLIVLGIFLAAAMVGVVVRLNLPDELPPEHAHGHDDHGHH